MTIEIKKTRTITRTAELELTRDDVEVAVIEAVKRIHKELKDYTFKIQWLVDNDGAIVTGTSSNGEEG